MCECVAISGLISSIAPRPLAGTFSWRMWPLWFYVQFRVLALLSTFYSHAWLYFHNDTNLALPPCLPMA